MKPINGKTESLDQAKIKQQGPLKYLSNIKSLRFTLVNGGFDTGFAKYLRPFSGVVERVDDVVFDGSDSDHRLGTVGPGGEALESKLGLGFVGDVVEGRSVERVLVRVVEVVKHFLVC